MDYTVFARMQSGEMARRADESPRDYMARAITAVCGENPAGCPATINDMLLPRLVACDVQPAFLTLAVETVGWMRNPQGTVHGGILATCADIAMGVLTRFLHGGQVAATVDLHINYLRPVPCGAVVEFRATVDRQGRRLTFLSAEGVLNDSRETVCKAIGIFV